MLRYITSVENRQRSRKGDSVQCMKASVSSVVQATSLHVVPHRHLICNDVLSPSVRMLSSILICYQTWSHGQEHVACHLSLITWICLDGLFSFFQADLVKIAETSAKMNHKITDFFLECKDVRLKGHWPKLRREPSQHPFQAVLLSFCNSFVISLWIMNSFR